ncbi:MAG: hypothetical protein GEV28_24755 [Actinophytocola sp.]|uniref:hypothetical protein n=1 Tax=Actinophytocola sp. TaxID=1872138 RepID=UPI00132B39E3|nr:hypothetical protein [Actinophytocola sp.]MPZ83426.1 hypothetical protein [Actinophytocola sp.]
MGFNITCSPGKDAAAGYMRLTEHLPALVIYLDPVNMAIQLPPFPGGEQLLAKFCRELAREATKLADAVDPADEPIYSTQAPRHTLPGDTGAADV